MGRTLSRMASIKALMSSRVRILKPANRDPREAALRSWRASLIRKRARVLGDVQAPTREQAELAAIKKFNLDDQRRSWLVVQERKLIPTNPRLRARLFL
jgi:hypothetical protein